MKRVFSFIMAVMTVFVLTTEVQATPLETPELNVQLMSATSARITWSQDVCTSFRLWVSAVELTGNPDTWKGAILTTETLYDATDLVTGRTYYVYLQGGYEGEVTEIASMSFTAQEPGDPCTYTIEMRDSWGDGWNCDGGLRFIEKGNETFITLSDGSEGIATYVSRGFPVQVLWIDGCDKSEVSFTIKNGDGIAILTVDDASVLSDGQVLFEGYFCGPACEATISDLDGYISSSGKQYAVSWNSEGAVSHEVAVVQISRPTEEELSKAAVAVDDYQYIFEGKNHAAYDVYVRGVCEDGQKGDWDSVRLCNPQLDLSDEVIKANAKTISLDYVEKGDLLESAICFGNSPTNLFPFLFYHLTVADSTEVSFSLLSEDLSMYGGDYMFVILQDTLAGAPLAMIDLFQTGTVKLKGDFYIMVEMMNKFGKYTLKIQKPKQFTFKTIEHPFFEEGDFTKANDFYFDWGGGELPSIGYKFTPSDTMVVRFITASSNTKGGVGIMMYQGVADDSHQIYGNSLGSVIEKEFLKDTTYYIILVSVPMYGGQVEDTYRIQTTVVPDASKPTEARLVQLDALFEDSFGANDWVNEFGYNGKVYEFVLTKDTTLWYSFELLGEQANNSMYRDNVSMYIYKDTVESSHQVAYFYGDYTYCEYTHLTGSAEGTHYFAVIYNERNVDANYRMVLRANADANNLPIKAKVNVGERYQSWLSQKDKLMYNYGIGSSGYIGSIQAYKVHLDGGKTYKIFSQVLPEGYNCYGEFQITLFDPAVTSGSFPDRTLDYTTSWYDGWRVLTVTAPDTADYTLVFGAPVDRAALADSTIYEFEVAEVMEAIPFVVDLPIVTDNYVATGNFVHNTKVLPSATYYFHPTPSSDIEYYGAFDAAACLFKVAAGDTLFVEFGGDEDAMIHIYDTDASLSADNPVIIDETPYSYPYESGFVVNEHADSALYIVVGSFVNVSLKNGAYSLRIATSEKELAPVVVTPKANKSSISIYAEEGVAVAQAELGKLVLTAVNASGGQVAVLENNPYLWQVDLDAKMARYELNNSDLPLGFVFAEPTVYVNVAINILTDIENVEESAVKSEKARKVMRNGHILIITPNGTFDMFGRKVE